MHTAYSEIHLAKQTLQRHIECVVSKEWLVDQWDLCCVDFKKFLHGVSLNVCI